MNHHFTYISAVLWMLLFCFNAKADVEDSTDNFINVVPKVYFQAFKLRNKPLSQAEFAQYSAIPLNSDETPHVRLPYKESMFGIWFSVLALANSHNIELSYRLEGFHQQWLTVKKGMNQASFVSIPPGEYLFVVKAVNKLSGLQSQKSLKITIVAPLWQSGWAYLGYAIALIVLTWLFNLARTRKLQRAAQQLKQGVDDKTRQLAQSNETILSLLEQKRRMFANMSHEFRTPLTLILSPLDRLLKAKDNPQDRKYLSIMDRNARVLLRMVDQLLKLAQLESKENIQYKTYQVNSCLNYVISTFEAMTADKGISISCQLEGELSALLIDDSLEAIIANLLSNAIKYSHDDGIIDIQCSEGEGHLKLVVQDNGLGIDEANQTKIFEPFCRDDAISKMDIDGCGVGLALVKELVDANKGRLTLESALGKGSCFTVYLPLEQKGANLLISELSGLNVAMLKNESAIEIIRQQPALLPTEQPSDVYKPSLVIIDDNSEMRTVLLDLLSDDYNCTAARDGEEGIKLVIETVPDVVICDLMMPTIDGFVVCKTLKADERTCHIPLLLLTAKSDMETRIAGWRENIDEFISKPFNETELKARVSNVLTIRNILRKRLGQYVTAVNETECKMDHLNDKDQVFLDRFKTMISDHLGDKNLNQHQAASIMAVSERQLQRKLNALMNHTFSEYLRYSRLEKASALLKNGQQVSQVVEAVGFTSVSYFGVCFKAEFGQTPKQYQLAKAT